MSKQGGPEAYLRNQITDVGETVRLSKGNGGGKETMEEALWVTIRVRA